MILLGERPDDSTPMDETGRSYVGKFYTTAYGKNVDGEADGSSVRNPSIIIGGKPAT
jgi:hypothetical protein